MSRSWPRASKEELFAELLQSTVYAAYRAMGERQLAGDEPIPTARETAKTLARIQAHPSGRWMFRLWLELLLEAGRDEKMRALAAEFRRGNRELIARIFARRFADAGRELPADATTPASAAIAMDIGLAIQRYVDPEVVPLDVYPEAFGTLFDGVSRVQNVTLARTGFRSCALLHLGGAQRNADGTSLRDRDVVHPTGPLPSPSTSPAVRGRGGGQRRPQRSERPQTS